MLHDPILAALLAKLFVTRFVTGLRLASEVEPARLVLGLAVGLLIVRMV